MIAGTVTSVEQIAARDKCSIRQVNMTISLAFLAPELVRQPSRDDIAARRLVAPGYHPKRRLVAPG
jgi:hypothetical protein